MAVESSIGPAEGWFFGEDKTLRFRVTGDTAGIATWQLEWSLYDRRNPTTPLVTHNSSSGVAATPAAGSNPAIITVFVPRTDTLALDPKTQLSYVLRRSDPGNVQILAYGMVVMRSSVLT